MQTFTVYKANNSVECFTTLASALNAVDIYFPPARRVEIVDAFERGATEQTITYGFKSASVFS